MSEFADILAKAIERAGYNQLTFAKQVKTSQGRIRDILARRYGGKAPLNFLQQWAEALRLTGKDRDDFLWAALMSHCPANIRDEYLRMRNRSEKLERRIAELEEKRP